MLVLSRKDVEALLDLDALVDALAEAFEDLERRAGVDAAARRCLLRTGCSA